MQEEREVKQERSGWRDLAMSARHRLWGWDCPATDIDFLEYNYGWPVAITEYKHERAYIPDKIASPLKAQINLGNQAQIPVFLVTHADDFSWFDVRPMNDHAKKHLSESCVMTETDWVSLLYKIRGMEVPDSVLERLNGNGSEASVFPSDGCSDMTKAALSMSSRPRQ
mgnify:CR=1 FL=1